MIGIGLVGFGYWGPNLARNFQSLPQYQLAAICEMNPERAALASQNYPTAAVTTDYAAMLDMDGIDAIVIATPVSTHFELTRAALLAGKDVLVEKPFTRTSAEARELIDLAETRGRIIAVDHTFLYTGAVQTIKRLVEAGELGKIVYIDSVRINLGLFQSDVNVIYDLAPHDLSITQHLLERDPVAVQAVGASHAGNDIENIAYLHLEYEDNLIAHFHVNWLSPVKVRHFLIGGTSKMIVYDDMQPSEKVKVYDKGIVIKEGDVESLYRVYVDYRTGDMVAPKLPFGEALRVEAEHFAECVETRCRPISDGHMGLSVVRVLEAAQRSIKHHGDRVELSSI